MPKKHQANGLGARERQILDVIYQLGEASVAEVLANLPDPPSYSAVRTMIRMLEKKGLLERHPGLRGIVFARRGVRRRARIVGVRGPALLSRGGQRRHTAVGRVYK